ncbi:MAG: AbrB/MazE/SpoVT family DNA-binding domain-containing protein [Thaumarchaeota archaeon]|nr:AbrB/MazE/SpoVT family DNA-binding domain-containing protein [Nitrososphaerota archaeon]
MVRIKVRLGAKGQLVIPKVIRESLGLTENKFIILELKDKTLELKGVDENIPDKWELIAKREGLDVTESLVYGDKLYEQVFS